MATLDRVLQWPARSAEDTARRVREAIDRHAFRPFAAGAELARGRSSKFAFVMPEGSNVFMSLILDHVAEMSGWLAARRAAVETNKTDVFNPEALARTLESLAGRYDGIAVVALDHQSVRAAIDDLVAGRNLCRHARVRCAQLAPPSLYRHRQRRRWANRWLTDGAVRPYGRRQDRRYRGSQSLRDHAERIFGFNQVMGLEFPHLGVLSPVEGNDHDGESETLMMRLIADHPDLIGVYNVARAPPEVAKAITDAGRESTLTFIGHDLSNVTRKCLLRGVMDAVVAQDSGHETRSAMRVLLSLVRGERFSPNRKRSVSIS